MATKSKTNGSTGAKHPKNPWRPKDMIEDNPIGLSEAVTRKIIPRLDELVASMFVLYHQYQKHHWLVEGPQYMELHLYLEKAYNQVHADLDLVAERETVLGGIPVSSPRALADKSIFEHEPEGTFHIRHSLERDMDFECQLAARMRELIKLAMDQGDYGTETLIRGVLANCEHRAHDLDHFLGEDSLEIGRDSQD